MMFGAFGKSIGEAAALAAIKTYLKKSLENGMVLAPKSDIKPEAWDRLYRATQDQIERIGK